MVGAHILRCHVRSFGSHIGLLAGRQASWVARREAGMLVVWQAGRLAGRLAGRETSSECRLPIPLLSIVAINSLF